MAMLRYSATQADGTRTEGMLNAPSVVSAREQLESQGLHQVVLREAKASARPGSEPEPLGLSAGQQREMWRFKLRLEQTPSWSSVLREQARRSRLWLLADFALVAYGLARGEPIWVAAGVLAAAVPFALTAWSCRHVDRYERLLRHYAVGQWDAVRALAKELRGISASRPEMDFDLDLRLACIYARDHALAGALARLEPWRKRMATQPGAFETRVAPVVLMSGDTAGYVAMMAQAHELNPGDPARRAEHALAHARFGKVDAAESLLAGLDPAGLPPLDQVMLQWATGLVHLRRRRPEAQAALGQAVDGWLPFAQQPALWTLLAMCACDHAVAMHEAGSHAAARARVAEVWPVLEAHATVPLQRMLEADDLLPLRSPQTP